MTHAFTAAVYAAQATCMPSSLVQLLSSLCFTGLYTKHVCALRLQISKDEEELARKRMEVKRGLPLQDLSGKRGFPDDPRQAANEKMHAEVILLVGRLVYTLAMMCQELLHRTQHAWHVTTA